MSAKPPRIRLGMVGGGEGAFIGAVHRTASRLDDEFVLVCGALSSTPEKARASGLALGLTPDRAYGSLEEMIAGERARPPAERMEALSIVTPNHLHVAAARAALEAGFHVICDKPLATTRADAEALAALARDAGLVFAVTHNYSGHPLVRHARALVAAGEIGRVRVVQVEYAQAWLADALESTGQKQASWRTDPARSGAGGAIGDIGTHAFHLASFVTGLAAESLLAELSTFVPGRRLDDDAQILLRYENGARGTLWASQVAHGHENGLRLRVYGERGGLEWSQENPNELWLTPQGEPTRRLTRAGAGLGPEAARVTRLPSGHPEGYLEAFGTIYAEVARAIRAHGAGAAPDPAVAYPGVEDGVWGLRFIEAAVASARAGGAWTAL